MVFLKTIRVPCKVLYLSPSNLAFVSRFVSFSSSSCSSCAGAALPQAAVSLRHRSCCPQRPQRVASVPYWHGGQSRRWPVHHRQSSQQRGAMPRGMCCSSREQVLPAGEGEKQVRDNSSKVQGMKKGVQKSRGKNLCYRHVHACSC